MSDHFIPREIRATWRSLTRRQRWVLKRLRDEEETDLVLEGRSAYCGDDPISPSTVLALLRMCALRLDSGANDVGKRGSVERYSINATGRALLEWDMKENAS